MSSFWAKGKRRRIVGPLIMGQRMPASEVIFVADEASMDKTFLLMRKMSSKYAAVIWNEFNKGLPKLHKKAGEIALNMGVPWEVVGPFARPIVYPRTAMNVQIDVAGGPSSFASQSNVGPARYLTKYTQPKFTGHAPDSGAKTAPIGFGFSMAHVDMHQYTSPVVAKQWAIPQPPFPGAPFGASPWFTGSNWTVKEGRIYPFNQLLWREELGLAGTKTQQAVVSALSALHPEQIWPAPPYTQYRKSGYVIAQGKKIGIHWVPPSHLGMGRPISENLELAAWDEGNRFEPGPGLMPKLFLKAATIIAGQAVAIEAVSKLSRLYKTMSEKDRTLFRAAVGHLPVTRLVKFKSLK